MHSYSVSHQRESVASLFEANRLGALSVKRILEQLAALDGIERGLASDIMIEAV
jgi:hypothetical protein